MEGVRWLQCGPPWRPPWGPPCPRWARRKGAAAATPTRHCRPRLRSTSWLPRPRLPRWPACGPCQRACWPLTSARPACTCCREGAAARAGARTPRRASCAWAHAPSSPPPPARGAPAPVVRDDDPASIVAYFLAGAPHAAFVDGWTSIVEAAVGGSGSGRGAVADTDAAPAALAAAVDALPAGGGAATPPTSLPGPSPHFEAAIVDDAPGAGGAELRVRHWYAPHFAALRSRAVAGGDAGYRASLARTLPWSPAGGKSGARFAKSADGCLIIKEVRPRERAAFCDLAPSYFDRVGSEASRSMLGRILGVYTVTVGAIAGGGGGGGSGGSTVDLIVMENLLRPRPGRPPPTAVYDLKGTDVALGGAGGNGASGGDAVDVGAALHDGDLSARAAAAAAPPLTATAYAALTAGLAADAALLRGAGVMDYSLLAGLVPAGGGERRAVMETAAVSERRRGTPPPPPPSSSSSTSLRPGRRCRRLLAPVHVGQARGKVGQSRGGSGRPRRRRAARADTGRRRPPARRHRAVARQVRVPACGGAGVLFCGSARVVRPTPRLCGGARGAAAW